MRLAAFCLVGLILGVFWGQFGPANYLGKVTLYFPGVQPQLFQALTRSLKATPEFAESSSSLSEMARPDLVPIAAAVLSSQSAAEFALQGSDQKPEVGRSGNLIGQFSQNLKIQRSADSLLVLTLSGRSPTLVRQQLASLLQYYDRFVDKTPLTPTRTARLAVEARLKKVSLTLGDLEKKMANSRFQDLRKLGDSSIHADPKVMHMVWMRRLDEERRGRDLLNRMQKGREQAKAPRPEEAAWLADWTSQQKVVRSSPALKLPVRREDLLQRAELERSYYDNLLKHRSYLLQQSFLATLEDLESFKCEPVDTISVIVDRSSRWKSALAGFVLGAALGLLSRPRRKLR